MWNCEHTKTLTNNLVITTGDKRTIIQEVRRVFPKEKTITTVANTLRLKKKKKKRFLHLWNSCGLAREVSSMEASLVSELMWRFWNRASLWTSTSESWLTRRSAGRGSSTPRKTTSLTSTCSPSTRLVPDRNLDALYAPQCVGVLRSRQQHHFYWERD